MKIPKMNKTNKIYKITIDKNTLAKLYAIKSNHIKLTLIQKGTRDPDWDEIVNWALDSLLNAQEKVMNERGVNYVHNK